MRKWKRKKICQILHLSVTVFSQIFLTDDLTLHAFSTYIFRSIFNLKNNVLDNPADIDFWVDSFYCHDKILKLI